MSEQANFDQQDYIGALGVIAEVSQNVFVEPYIGQKEPLQYAARKTRS
jgi:hypothetical protein